MSTIGQLPSFTGKRKNRDNPKPPQPPEEKIYDCIVVDTGQKQSQAKRLRLEDYDPESHLRATIPPMDGFISSGGKLNPKEGLLSPEEFMRINTQHDSYFIFAMLSELSEQGPGARKAIRELSTHANNPVRKISKASQEYLKPACLISNEGKVPGIIRADVRQIVSVEDFSDRITLTPPPRKAYTPQSETPASSAADTPVMPSSSGLGRLRELAQKLTGWSIGGTN